jgi:AcrR family transcriptional regulator
MKAAIEAAFLLLLQECSYEALTISDITERANVGRSTFYRYFETKTDLLIAMHATIFTRFNFVGTTQEDWLKDEPPAGMVDFLSHMQRMDRRSPAYFTLTKDLTFSREMMLIMRRITEMLSRQVSDGLREAFGDTATKVPLGLLSHSIVGQYTTLFEWWLTQTPELTPADAARHIHHLIRAVVREALSA